MCAKHAAWIMMLLVLVVASPPASAQSPSAQVTQVRDGRIVAIDRSSGTVTIEYAVGGQPEQLVVLVQDFTRLSVTEADGERTASIATLMVGDRIVVEGLRLNDGRFVATAVKATRGAVGTSPPPATQSGAATTSQPAGPGGSAPRPEPDSGTQSTGSPVQLKGVVTVRDSSGLIVADIAGARRRVTLTGNVRVEGQRDSISAILPRDFIVVEGMLNADGSLTALSIEVVLAARNVITGRITAIGNGFVVLDGNRTVRVTADTLVLVNGELRSVADLQVGAEVSVSGVAETTGGLGGGAASGAVEAVGGATGGGPGGLVGTIIDAVNR